VKAIKRIVTILFFVAGVLALPWQTALADPAMAFAPGTVTEQQYEIPAPDTPLPTILDRLESERTETKEGALLWLLQWNNATNLSYFAFPQHSIRFGVDRVTKHQAGPILWRLVECQYVSRSAFRSGTEYRAMWKVAYLFDDLGQLRDWIEDYKLLLADDFNLDKKLDILAYIDSPKRVIMLSHDRGRSRELLNVEGVPPRGQEISRTPREPGQGVDVTYAAPVEVVDSTEDQPKVIRIVDHGTYRWNVRQNKYAHNAQLENSPAKK
jgi:hypothetical protein